MPTMPPVPSENHSVTQEDGDELPQFAHEELIQLKNVARSRSNFAVLLLSQNINGVATKSVNGTEHVHCKCFVLITCTG